MDEKTINNITITVLKNGFTVEISGKELNKDWWSENYICQDKDEVLAKVKKILG